MANLRVVRPATPTTLSRLVEDYLVACRARGLSPKTRDAYAYPLRAVFLPFCAKEGIREPDQLSSRVLDRLSTKLLDEGGPKGELSKYSVHTYLRPINQFIAWAQREAGVGIRAKAQLPRRPRREVDVLDREEIQRLEDAASNARDKIIVRLLGDTGMRVGELIGLRVADLLPNRGGRCELRITGKGDHERTVPILPRVYQRVKRYVERERPRDSRSPQLFLSLRRHPVTGQHEPLTESGVQQLLRAVAEVAGLDKRVHPHLLRHSFITHAAQRNMNPMKLQQIVGHNDLTMIARVYTHIQASDAHEDMVRLLTEP